MCYIAIYDVTIPFLFPHKNPQRFIWNGQLNVVNIILFRRNLPLIQVCIDIIHVIKRTFQRHQCYAFDSPGLPNDSAGYPGLAYVVGGTMPSVLRFLSVIHHEYPRYKPAFSKKAQHLWRWIPLRMLTQGRLVPRQPWAIKRTTPTALHHKGIFIAKYIHGMRSMKRCMRSCYNIHNGIYIHGDIGIKSTALHRCNIHNAKYIHGDIGIITTALHCCNSHNAKYIHGDIGIKSTALHRCNIHNGTYIHGILA